MCYIVIFACALPDVLMPGRVLPPVARLGGGSLRRAAAAPARAALHLAEELRAPVLLPPRGRRQHRRVHPRRAAQPRAAHRHQHDVTGRTLRRLTVRVHTRNTIENVWVGAQHEVASQLETGEDVSS